MQFITTPERIELQRIGLCEGLRISIKAVLNIRFGKAGLQLMPEIEEVHHEDQLMAILNALKTVANLDEVRAMCKSTGS